MKNKSAPHLVSSKPSDDEIRDFAYHLFEQGDHAPGQDLAHWFEASAFLSSNQAPQHHGTHHNPPIKQRGAATPGNAKRMPRLADADIRQPSTRELAGANA